MTTWREGEEPLFRQESDDFLTDLCKRAVCAHLSFPLRFLPLPRAMPYAGLTEATEVHVYPGGLHVLLVKIIHRVTLQPESAMV